MCASERFGECGDVAPKKRRTVLLREAQHPRNTKCEILFLRRKLYTHASFLRDLRDQKTSRQRTRSRSVISVLKLEKHRVRGDLRYGCGHAALDFFEKTFRGPSRSLI